MEELHICVHNAAIVLILRENNKMSAEIYPHNCYYVLILIAELLCNYYKQTLLLILLVDIYVHIGMMCLGSRHTQAISHAWITVQEVVGCFDEDAEYVSTILCALHQAE